MRTNDDFIEVTTGVNGKKILVNKSAIIFVTREDESDQAIITTINGDRFYRIIAKETYGKVADCLLNWVDFKIAPVYGEPEVCGLKKEDKDG